MSDSLAREMYKEHILELFKHPPNFGELSEATHSHRAHNPVCGDDITMQVVVKDGKIENIKFKGVGCAISVAASGLLTDAVKGKTVETVGEMKKEDILKMLLIPISPVRLKCALLGLEALQKAVKNGNTRN